MWWAPDYDDKNERELYVENYPVIEPTLQEISGDILLLDWEDFEIDYDMLLSFRITFCVFDKMGLPLECWICKMVDLEKSSF
jgi:hypothetical protein